MAGHGCLGLGLFCWVLLAVPVGPQPASSVPGAPLTTLTPPPQSEASVLSLNLGLNFKLHLRGPAAAWGSPVTETQPQPLSPGPSRELEKEVASGPKTDPLLELLVGSLGNSPPEWGSAEGSSTPWASSLPLESTSPSSGSTDQPTALYQPRMGTVTWDTALTATAPPSSAPRPHQSELELKFDMALRAGAAPTLGHRMLPLLPSLRASLAEIAGRLGPFGEYSPHPEESPCWAAWQVGGSFSPGSFCRVFWHYSVPTPELLRSEPPRSNCIPKLCLWSFFRFSR